MNEVYDLTRRIDALEKEIDRLKRATANLPIRTSGGGGGGGGGGFSIATYEDFPDIPGVPTIISCKEQNWYAEPGYTAWIPQSLFTSETGAPGT